MKIEVFKYLNEHRLLIPMIEQDLYRQGYSNFGTTILSIMGDGTVDPNNSFFRMSITREEYEEFKKLYN